MIKLIIFDLDGTLADTILDIRDGLNGMLNELGLPNVTTKQTLANINNGALELVRRSLPEQFRENEELVKQTKAIYEKYYSGCYNNKTAEYSGITNSLKALREQGILLAVLSNKQHEFVQKIVEKLFSDVTFEFTVGQSKYVPTKPDPTAVINIIDSLNVIKSQVLLVGDSNIDMLTAINAGITPIGVSWGYRPPNMLIECGARLILNSPQDIAKLPNLLS